MATNAIEFVRGSPWRSHEKQRNTLKLCPSHPIIEPEPKTDIVLTNETTNPRSLCNLVLPAEDGLYAGSIDPLTRTVVKPYHLDQPHPTKVKPKSASKLLEIAIREVNIQPSQNVGTSDSTVQVTSVAVMYKGKVVCRSSSPFNRELYKLLLRDAPGSSNLSIQVLARGGSSSILPLPLPRRSVKNTKLDIDFAITGSAGVVHSGTVLCTISLTIQAPESQDNCKHSFFATTNDPNDPRNSGSTLRPRVKEQVEDVKHFSLLEPALFFQDPPEVREETIAKRVHRKPPETVLLEQPIFSMENLSFKNFFRSRRPLRPSSSTHSHKLLTGRKKVLVVAALRGVEVPIREESALVQPLLEIEWDGNVHTTSMADGPAPIWQQTFRFETSQDSKEQCVKLRLYDQHPVWGLQWLGEARIPMESRSDHQELERWVELSPLYSPILSFGYLQASPGHSYTRIYVLMKMEQPGNPQAEEFDSIDTLSKAVYRCTAVPYKIEGLEDAEDASRLAMLLPSLPLRYGPLTPRQALQLNKVDHFGRAALLTSLLQGLGLQSSVLLGSSQTRRWAAYVLTIDETMGTVVWDPETGDHYNPADNRCSLIKVSRLINNQNIWENTQRCNSLADFKFDTKSSKDWRPLASNKMPHDGRSVQTLDLNNMPRAHQEGDSAEKIEQHLREELSQWRSVESLTTVFNRHAATILRGFLSKLEDCRSWKTKVQPDKKELRQLYRAYHTHGLVLNVRQADLSDLSEQLSSTKIHKTTGPVEFALVCHVQRYIGNANSLWLAVVVLRSRN